MKVGKAYEKPLSEEEKHKIYMHSVYEEPLSDSKKEVIERTFLFGFTAACAALIFVATYSDLGPGILDTSTKWMNTTLGLLNSYQAVYNFNRLKEAIESKTDLENEIERLNKEFKKRQSEENRGSKRW